MKNLILSMACLAFCSCAALVVASTAVVVTEEFQNNAITITVPQNVEVVWASTKSSLAHMTDAMIRTDEDLKSAATTIDGAAISVNVQNWDTGETRLRVMAKEYVLYNHELANLVADRILKELRDATGN